MDLGLELNKNKVDRNLILKGIGEITQFLSFFLGGLPMKKKNKGNRKRRSKVFCDRELILKQLRGEV